MKSLIDGRGKAVVLGIFLLLAMSCVGQAKLITIEIEAVVDSVTDQGEGDGYLDGQVSAGDTITGYYVYESTTEDQDWLLGDESPTVGRYHHFSPPAGMFLSVGGFDFETDFTDVDFLIEVGNNHSGIDGYLVRSYNNLPLSNGTVVENIDWQIQDPSCTALSNDTLPSTAPVLSDWDFNELVIDGERLGYLIRAHVTSAIPEPATILLVGIGALLIQKRR